MLYPTIDYYGRISEVDSDGAHISWTLTPIKKYNGQTYMDRTVMTKQSFRYECGDSRLIELDVYVCENFLRIKGKEVVKSIISKNHPWFFSYGVRKENNEKANCNISEPK